MKIGGMIKMADLLYDLLAAVWIAIAGMDSRWEA